MRDFPYKQADRGHDLGPHLAEYLARLYWALASPTPNFSETKKDPLKGMLRELKFTEIPHLVVFSAIAIRMECDLLKDCKEEALRAYCGEFSSEEDLMMKLLKEDGNRKIFLKEERYEEASRIIEEYYKETDFKPRVLSLYEACNKIIHAEETAYGIGIEDEPPYLLLAGDKYGSPWVAEIDLCCFAEQSLKLLI